MAKLPNAGKVNFCYAKRSSFWNTPIRSSQLLTFLAISFPKPVDHQVTSEHQKTNFGMSHACHLKLVINVP
jgi:hypothetical protein